MSNVGSAAAGKTLIGAGNGASPTYASIGTNSGLTAHGVVVAEGNGAFVASSPGSVGQVLTSNGIGSDPTFQTVTATGAITTITGNSGAAESPLSGNFNILGTGSITIAGSANTETVQLTGLTNHAVLVGAGTATITKVGPTATSGQVLQSAGASSDPVFSTATYPSTTTINQILYSSSANVVSGITSANNGTLITGISGIPSVLANGTTGQVLTATTGSPPSWAPPATSGTVTTVSVVSANGFAGTVANASSTPAITLSTTITGVLSGNGTAISGSAVTQYDVLVGGASNAISSVGPGSAGQVLQSGGNAANPVYSTATYPSTAGTSGNVLTSDGTNWISAAPGGVSNLFYATGTLTNAQIKAIHTTPVQLIAAAGSGKFIHILTTTFKLIYGGTNAFTGAGNLTLTYGSGTAITATGSLGGSKICMTSTSMNQTSNNYTCSCLSADASGVSGISQIAATSLENTAIFIWNTSADPGGNAANNNTISWAISYLVETI